MKDFQSRASTVKAVRWESDAIFEKIPNGIISCRRDGKVYLTTPEGDREIKRGDWLVMDAAGIYFPMTDDVFQLKYEAIEIRTLSLIEN